MTWQLPSFESYAKFGFIVTYAYLSAVEEVRALLIRICLSISLILTICTFYGYYPRVQEDSNHIVWKSLHKCLVSGCRPLQ